MNGRPEYAKIGHKQYRISFDDIVIDDDRLVDIARDDSACEIYVANNTSDDVQRIALTAQLTDIIGDTCGIDTPKNKMLADMLLSFIRENPVLLLWLSYFQDADGLYSHMAEYIDEQAFLSTVNPDDLEGDDASDV